MKRENAYIAKGLDEGERKARLAKMVEDGEITREQASLIDFREPSTKARQFGERLAESLKQTGTRTAGASA